MTALFRPQNEPGARVFESFFIQLAHPGGKIWQSLYIPRTKMGALGFSITRWGKDEKVKGQAQIKEISLGEWKNVVAKKIRTGGYTPVSYAADENMDYWLSDVGTASLGSNYPSFNLTADDLQRITGFTVNELDENKADPVFVDMARGYMNFPPTREFLTHINQNSMDIASLFVNSDHLRGFGVELAKLLGVDAEYESKPIAPKPPRDLAQEYQSWGVFS